MKLIDVDPSIEVDAKQFIDAGFRSKEITLVIGASGMLGSYITGLLARVNALNGDKKEIHAFVRSQDQYLDLLARNSNLSIHESSEFSNVARKMNDVHVIHAASPASISSHHKNKKDMIESNVFLTRTICDVLSFTQGHLTYLSSGEVYGINPKIPTKENDYSAFDHLDTRGSYPESKRMGELIAKTWSEMHDFSASVLRVYHTFGPGLKQNDDRIFASAMYSLLNKENIALNSNGSATRSFMYTYDLLTAITRISDLSGFQAINVSSDIETTIMAFAKLVASMGKDISVTIPLHLDEISKVSTRSPIQRGAADNSLLKEIGWQSEVELVDGINRTLDSLKWRQETGLI